MNQIPLTNMEGRYITPSTREAFDALVWMGYKTLREYAVHVQYGAKYLFISRGIIDSVKGRFLGEMKQAYYHKGHFYDQPCEEFTITEEKVPFPELEDIEWVMVHIKDTSLQYIFSLEYTNKKLLTEKVSNSYYIAAKKLFELSIEGVEVTWKPKIDRRLHKNRPLALAIGRWLDEGVKKWVDLDSSCELHVVSILGKYFTIYDNKVCQTRLEAVCTIPDDYIIPDQVIEWIHEYKKEEQCKPST